MLTNSLRSLERDGIVKRKVYPEVPPRVEYELTEFGLGVLDPLKLLVGWVVENWGQVKKSRDKYDLANKKK